MSTFSSVRPNSQIFILNKENIPTLTRGTVVSVIPVTPPNAYLMQRQDYPITMTVKVNGNTEVYEGLPPQADIADFRTGIVLSTSREAMSSEITAMMQRSKDIIDSVAVNKGIVDGCEKALQSLIPEYAEKQQQSNEMSVIKDRIESLSKSMDILMKRLENDSSSS